MNEAQHARRGWRRFLPIVTRLSMARRLRPRSPWLAAWIAPEASLSMVERLEVAQQIIVTANSLAEWVAPEINIVAPMETDDERGGRNSH